MTENDTYTDGTDRLVEQIRDFADHVDEPEKYRVAIPVDKYESVIESLDTVKNISRYYKGITLCYSDTREETWLEYSSSLSEHIQSVESDTE